MKILVIGSGGREHAVIKAVKKNPRAEHVYAIPGNGGIAADAECIPIGVKETEKIVDFAVKNNVDYAIVTPDDPLVLGTVDALAAAGIPAFGPDKKAAVIEGSKAFSKALMKKYSIPTASYETFTELDAALAYVACSKRFPLVIKADGLALGKGVVIAENASEAEDAVRSMMVDKVFGDSGSCVVIEEFLEGPEVSVLAFTDGKTLVPMISSMDHKRALDGDRGLNTGGMGTIAPNPFYTAQIAERCMREIFMPTVEAMREEGRTFKGCLYFGLMLTADGPRVIEYNCRFGDPETQVVLPLLESDLLDIMMAVTSGTLDRADVRFSEKSACCVIMASRGYPAKYDKGYRISIPAELSDDVYVAGAALNENGELVTSGGRVLGVTSVAETTQGAVNAAYEKVARISFENEYHRSDIGARALGAIKGEN